MIRRDVMSVMIGVQMSVHDLEALLAFWKAQIWKDLDITIE